MRACDCTAARWNELTFINADVSRGHSTAENVADSPIGEVAVNAPKFR
jgi:hypothetical protein